MPDEEGSILLADVIYQKESKLNVCQEETFCLSKRLRGTSSICFVLHNKVHIKGFSFQKKNRAFKSIMAANCDCNGDTFAITERSVEGIGNNVSLEFEQMDFGSEGATKLVVFGRSPIDKNTIHIRFAIHDGESNQFVDFTLSDGYEKQVFGLDKITGNTKSDLHLPARLKF
jgi:beta-galactosidase